MTRARARARFTEPVAQRYSPPGWVLARQPGLACQHEYRVLHRGQHVGWLIHEAAGWRWQTPDPRKSYARSITSKAVYPSWEKAAAVIARTGWAKRIAGGLVTPTEWRRAGTLPPGRQPWTPRPKPETAGAVR